MCMCMFHVQYVYVSHSRFLGLMIFIPHFASHQKNHKHNLYVIIILNAYGKISVRFAQIKERRTVSNKSNVLVKIEHLADSNH